MVKQNKKKGDICWLGVYLILTPKVEEPTLFVKSSLFLHIWNLMFLRILGGKIA